jgi:predicted O-methyltransferase YrrM
VNIKTFYKIYYLHRFKKGSIYSKIYILIFLPFFYFINKLLLQTIIDLDKFSLSNKELYEKDFKFLFQFFNSDKGKFYVNQYQKPIKLEKKLSEGHDYHEYYERYFESKKKNDVNILEIGTFKGNATAAFFFYFKKAKIISGDIFPDLFRYRSKRINNFYIDNSIESELEKKILKNDIKYDFIIEDAGHYYKDQIITLFSLFPSLKSNGVFVIEELDFPNTRKDMNPNQEKPTLRDILFFIKENKDFKSDLVSKLQKDYFLSNFSSIEVFKGRFNEIAFIKKK